jgi:hypothetical protein
MQHDMPQRAGSGVPTLPGQAAFGAMAEVVRILSADSTTDWTKVNLEALRQHLIDMDEVTMRASVKQSPVPGGMQADVTGRGRAIDAIRRMAMNQSRMLSQDGRYSAKSSEIPGGARVVVTAKGTFTDRDVVRIRGLGFAGLMTEGDHHTRHHLALARGDAMAHER